ncbi:MAG: hypothetical protein GXP18_00570, partial [Gammaproteobacteria bacterium]|nr:hypothetical protein [Gammaproteobacteria bacterium]
HVDAIGSPADSMGIQDERNQKAEKIAEEKAATQNASAKLEDRPATQKPLFETQEINRSIRPQQDVAVRKSKRGPSTGWIIGTTLFLAVVSGMGWFYLSGADAPEKLKAVMDQGTETLSEITSKVTSTIGEMGQSEPETSAASDAKDARSEKAMARLRERLESIKAEAAQKKEVKAKPPVAPVVTTPAVVKPPVADVFSEEIITPVPDMQTEEPVTETAVETENALETVDDVMKALNTPELFDETTEPEAAIDTVEPEVVEPEVVRPETTDTVTEDEIGTVESVNNLPIVDEATADVDVTAIETVVETTAPVVTASDSVTEESGDTESGSVDVVVPVPAEEESTESVVTP